ncbi:MAG: S-layer domain protein [Pseudarthrobacter sp.]|nr:S-layer domain protein [Pseudarthrobacter sp.]
MLEQGTRFCARFFAVLAVLSALIFFGLTPANAADLNNASVSGTVTVPAGIDKTKLSISAQASGSYYGGQLNEDGTYQVSGLPAGSYKVFLSAYYSGALNQWYGGGTSFETASAVPVSAGQTVSGLNMTLLKGASIAGKITVPSGVDPQSVEVSAKTESWSFGGQSQVNPDGTYKILGLVAGVYKVQFYGYSSGTLEKWYGDASTFEAATPVTLTAGQDLAGIDAVLVKGASISGKITVPAGVQPQMLSINVSSTEGGSYAGYGYANDAGEYSVKGLPAGTYNVQFSSYNSGLLDQWYKNAGSLATATAVTVSAGQDIAGIDATLLKGATISGKLTAPAGVDFTSMNVSVQAVDRSMSRGAQVSAEGTFSVSGLPAGKYKVEFDAGNSGALDQWYKNASSFDAATEVTVSAAQTVTGIDAVLLKAASVSGVVTAPAGVDKSRVSVSVTPTTGYAGAGYAAVAADGSYKVSGLAAGSYKVQFSTYGSGALDQWYPGATSSSAATTIVLTAGQELTGISASLVKAASVSGKITAPAGANLSAVQISATRTDVQGPYPAYAYAYAQSDGTYKLLGLHAGTYSIEFHGYSSGLLSQTGNAAKTAVLAAGQDLTGLNTTMVTGASISGTISAPAGVDVSWVNIEAVQDDGVTIAGSTRPGMGGSFTINGLPAGTYKLIFRSQGSGALDEWFDNAATATAAAPIVLTAGQARTGVNAVLAKGGIISGKVIAPAGVDLAKGYTNATIFQADDPNSIGESASIAAGGTYSLRGLPTGSYKIRFSSYNTGGQELWYGGAGTFAAAATITVVAGQSVAAADTTLVKGAIISGKITAPAGTDFSATTVTATGEGTAAGRQYGTQVSTSGTYSIIGMPAGTYKVRFDGGVSGAAQAWYGGSAQASAASLTLATSQTRSAIDITTVAGATLTGKVTGGKSTFGYPVNILDSAGNTVMTWRTDSDGTYSVKGLAAGSYKVAFNRSSGYSLEEAQFYLNKPESAGSAQAQSIAVAAGTTVPNVNAALVQGGSITGTATDPSGKPIAGAGVQAYTLNGTLITRSGSTDAAGKYTIPGLSTGQYIVKLWGSLAAPGGLYSGNASTEASATPVSVTSGKASALNLAYSAGLLTTAVPTITGTAKVGSVLTAVPGTWGPAPVTLAYQWKANGVIIIGATASTYKPVGANAGKTLTVTVTGTKAGYTTAAKTSATTASVAVGTLTAPTPTITGSAKAGSVLTAVPGIWGPAPVALAYQWKAGGVVIIGATASTYTPVAANVGKALTVTVTGTKTGYTTAVKMSAATTTIGVGTLTAPTPTVTGDATVGAVLTAVPGTWGPAPVTLAYQWRANGATITGATAATYSPATADLGKALTVTVTGTKAGFTTAAKTSATTLAVAAGILTAPAPTVIGTAKAGSTLTAVPGSWGPAPVTLAYQWKTNGAAITGATAGTYVPGTADLGKTVTVTVTGTKTGYATATATSAATSTVMAANPALTAPLPAITGTAKVGATLTAAPGIWGPAPVTLAYQWKANGVSIAGATASTYKPLAVHAGKTLTVTVTGTKAGYTTAAKTSAATAAVAAGTLTAPVPTVTGSVNVGAVLTAAPGTWGPSPVTVAYQWKANGASITGATATTYTPVAADLGKTLTVTVTGTKAGYTTAAKTSAATVAVAAGILTAPVPTITGTAKVDSVLTAVPGAWGPAPVTLAYQWKANGVAIAGATTVTYKPVAANVGKAISVTVTGTKTGYTPATKTSAATANVG